MVALTTRTENIAGCEELLVPVMVTVDPRRDTVDTLNKYLKGLHQARKLFKKTHARTPSTPEYHPRIRGLTGSEEQITKMRQDFHIYASRTGWFD